MITTEPGTLAGLEAASFSRMDPALAAICRYLDERQFDERWAVAEYRDNPRRPVDAVIRQLELDIAGAEAEIAEMSEPAR